MNSNTRPYWILSLLSLTSFGWIAYQLTCHQHESIGLCLFKQVTGVACPSCGTTRSVLLLLEGQLQEGLLLNPLGLLALALLIIIPVWIVYDLALQKRSLLHVYTLAERKIQQHRSIYIPLITIIVLNWVWNIAKGL